MTRSRGFYCFISAIVLITLSGCGSQPAAPTGTPGGTGAAASQQASTAAPGGDETELLEFTAARFDLPADAESSDLYTAEGGKYYSAAWAELAKKFNVRVTYRPVQFETRDETIRQMIASGSAPDAMLATLTPAEYRQYLSQGIIRTLPDGYEQGYANIQANLAMVLRRDAYRDDSGRYFAIPRAQEGAEPYADTAPGFYYRKDLAKLAGVEIKESYTLDELYAMFERVQAENPNMTMYGHAFPAGILELGVAEAAPQVLANGGFAIDSATGKAAYAYRQSAVAEGILTFKKFYDAWFLDRVFYDRPVFEARARFADGSLFAFSDAFNIPTAHAIYKDFQAVRESVNPADAIGHAWLTENDGSLPVCETGNSWSEWVFASGMQDRVLNRFLMIYDYLLGAEGLAMAVPGDSGHATPFISGAQEDSRVCALNPAYSEEARRAVADGLNLRKTAANLKIYKFDAALDDYLIHNRSKAVELKPAEAIAKIICDTRADGVEAAWQGWLSENEARIIEITDDMNAGR